MTFISRESNEEFFILWSSVEKLIFFSQNMFIFRDYSSLMGGLDGKQFKEIRLIFKVRVLPGRDKEIFHINYSFYQLKCWIELKLINQKFALTTTLASFQFINYYQIENKDTYGQKLPTDILPTFQYQKCKTNNKQITIKTLKSIKSPQQPHKKYTQTRSIHKIDNNILTDNQYFQQQQLQKKPNYHSNRQNFIIDNFLNNKNQLTHYIFLFSFYTNMYKLPNGQIVYPEDIQCVHDPVNGKGGVYIGNLQAAQNLQTLKKYGIKAVLTAAKGVFLDHPKSEVPFQLYIPGEDHERFDISKHFGTSIAFIRDALEKTNILVHCLAGVSRSVSLVMAYFIKYHGMNYDSVYSKIKGRRKIIHPNDGFITQLRKFELQCRESGPVIQRSELYEMRSSYSPSKRIQRRGYEGYYQSPQKYYESPDGRDSKGYQGIQLSSRYQYAQPDTVKNPQMYKSIVGDTQADRRYNDIRQHHFSPDIYEKQNRGNSVAGIKRMSSVNVDLTDRDEKTPQRGQLFSNYQRYKIKSRISSDYKPLDSIQNKNYDMDSEIDRKIAEIRKKYQQYTKRSETTKDRQDRTKLDRKYPSVIHEANENANVDQYADLKMRKIGTSYEHSMKDVYIPPRTNNYLQERQSSNAVNFIGSRLRRLQSYQI